MSEKSKMPQIGDSFHLVPRILNAFVKKFEKYEFWLLSTSRIPCKEEADDRNAYDS